MPNNIETNNPEQEKSKKIVVFRFPKPIWDNLEGVDRKEILKLQQEVRKFLIEEKKLNPNETDEQKILETSLEYLEKNYQKEETAQKIVFHLKALLEADYPDKDQENSGIKDEILLADFNEKYDWEAIYEKSPGKFFMIGKYAPQNEKSVEIDYVDEEGRLIGGFEKMNLEDFEKMMQKSNKLELPIMDENQKVETEKNDVPLSVKSDLVMKDVLQEERKFGIPSGPVIEMDEVNGIWEEKKENSEIDFEEKLRKARESFAQARAEAWQRLSLVERTLGSPTIDIDSIDTVNEAKKRYKRALEDLKNYKIEKLRDRRVELGDEGIKRESESLIEYFDSLNRIELADAIYLAKKEVKKGRFEELFGQISSQVIEKVRWYKKLPKKYQIALGVALLGGGIALASTGSVALGAGAISLDVARRLLGSVSAGVGAYDLTKKGVEWREKKKLEKSLTESKKEVQVGMVEGREYEVIERLIQSKIDETDEKIEKMRKKENIAKTVGFAIGALSFGVGTFKYLNQEGLTSIKSEIGKLFTGKDSFSPNFEASSVGIPKSLLNDIPEEIPDLGKDIPPYEAASEVQTEMPALSQSLEIKSGDNITRSLSQKGISGKKAYRMILEYAKEKGIDPKSLDTVYPGQKIILSPDGTKIIKILDSPDSYMMKSIRAISGENNSAWKTVKNLKFDELMRKPKMFKNFSGVLEKYQEILGKGANFKKDETVQRWVARMAKLAILKQK